MQRLRLVLAACLAACLATGCDTPTDDDPADPQTEAFAGGKADGFCVDEGGPVARGILGLVNDPQVTFEELDASTSAGGAGLYKTAARNIADARPFSDLAELDAVPYVGRHSCRALARYACNVQGRCRAPVRTMTWNLEQFPLTDETTDSVIELVHDLEADLIGVQEIKDVPQFERLADALPDYELILAEPGPFTRVGVLIRSSAFEVVHTEDLFVDDWFAFPRPVVAVTVRLRNALEPTTFTFAVVHLKARVDSRSEDRRRAGVERLRDWIDDGRERGYDNVMIVGDWNDRLTDAPASNVFSDLLDPDAEATFLTLDAAEAGQYTLVPFESMIDHIMVTDEVLEDLPHHHTEVLSLDETWSPRYTDLVSDHRPVMSTFSAARRY